MTVYKPGDKLEWRNYGGEWEPIGTYLATTSNGHVVCENSVGSASVIGTGGETRLARDTVTVTVEIDRAAAEATASHWNPVGPDEADRHQAFRAFIDACAEAVRP